MSSVEYVLLAVTGISVPLWILVLGWLIRIEARISRLEGKIECIKNSIT